MRIDPGGIPVRVRRHRAGGGHAFARGRRRNCNFYNAAAFSVNAADLALPPPAVGQPQYGMASPLAAALLRVVAPSVYAQAPQQQRPAPQEAARSGVSHDVISRLRQFAPTQRRQSRAVSLPPLPRPRPAELTSTTMEPTSEELAPASVQSDQTQTPKELAPAPDEPNEGPLND